MAATPRDLEPLHFRYLSALVRRLEERGVDAAVRRSVDLLTADAVPDRATRLAIRPSEPVVLVERLAVWALHRASKSAVVDAQTALESDAQTRRNRARFLVA
jgi:hypothetical protein